MGHFTWTASSCASPATVGTAATQQHCIRGFALGLQGTVRPIHFGLGCLCQNKPGSTVNQLYLAALKDMGQFPLFQASPTADVCMH